MRANHSRNVQKWSTNKIQFDSKNRGIAKFVFKQEFPLFPITYFKDPDHETPKIDSKPRAKSTTGGTENNIIPHLTPSKNTSLLNFAKKTFSWNFVKSSEEKEDERGSLIQRYANFENFISSG